MKRRAAAVITAAAVMMTSQIGAFAASEEVPEAAALTASRAAEEMGIGINLGNTFEAYNASGCEKSTYTWMPVVGQNTPEDYETCWGAPVTTQEMIDGFRDAGFKTVRIPVYWGNMMENDGTWTVNGEYIARVAEVVDCCLKDDLYTVINIHHFDEFIIRRHNTEECCEIFANLWTQIAEYFKDYPDKLVFEGFNEYLGASQFGEDGELHEQSEEDAFASANAINQTFVDSVRATGGNNAERVLIVSGVTTNIDKTTTSKFVMPEDTVEDRLMVSVHYVDNLMYWINLIGTKDWKDYSKYQCSLLKKAFTDKGIPVFVGETTSNYPRSNFGGNAEVKTSSECLEYILTLLQENGFVPVLWDVTDNFYDRTKCEIKDGKNAEVIARLTGNAPADESESESEADSESESESESEPEESSESASEAEPSSAEESSEAGSGAVSSAADSGKSSNPNTGTAAAMLLLGAVSAAATAVLYRKKN